MGKHRYFKKVDLVLVANENTPRGRWPMGLIEECQVDSDELVRTVIVRTINGIFKRDVRKICLLEGVDDDME